MSGECGVNVAVVVAEHCGEVNFAVVVIITTVLNKLPLINHMIVL